MAKSGKRIPISDAKSIGNKNGYNQVIILAWDSETGKTSVCTWGKSLVDCDQAAQGGNRIKKEILRWPEELCNDRPLRVKRSINKKTKHTVQCSFCKDDMVVEKQNPNEGSSIYFCNNCRPEAQKFIETFNELDEKLK